AQGVAWRTQTQAPGAGEGITEAGHEVERVAGRPGPGSDVGLGCIGLEWARMARPVTVWRPEDSTGREKETGRKKATRSRLRGRNRNLL
ncbi:hypothetical protein Taro_031700, partial [Colocasia esculenta]|nr:hypothetical protein [Colocasia esculenta]